MTEQEQDTKFPDVTESMRRHPAWLSRLETDDYYPIALVRVGELRIGDIVDVREFWVQCETDMAFLTITLKRGDDLGLYGFTGTLPNGTTLTVGPRYGSPMNRKRVVRYGRRAQI